MNIFSIFSKKKKQLAEVPEVNGIGKDYFFRMMSPQAMSLAKSYEKEEHEVLKKLADDTKDLENKNTVVIGAGTLMYVDLFFNKVKKYIAVEPLSKLFINKQFRFLVKQFPQLRVIQKRFNELQIDDLGNENKIMVFIFNILAYIENPINQINKIIKKGDILFLSSWNNTEEAKAVRKQYFDYLNSFENEIIIDSEKTIGLCNLGNFPFSELKYYDHHKRIKGIITDILIIYT